MQPGEVAGDQRLFLCACPALKLALALHGRFKRGVLLREDKRYGQAYGCVFRALAGLMHSEPHSEIVRRADVEAAVAAFEDVDPQNRRVPFGEVGGGFRWLSLLALQPFDSLRSLRAFDSLTKRWSGRIVL
jgi:hypothetical protein